MGKLPEELLEIMRPEHHELRIIRRGVRVEISAGCELDYRVRLAQVRGEISLAINGLGIGHGDGERRTGETPVPREGQEMIGDEDPFEDGGEDDDAGPEIGGMECAADDLAERRRIWDMEDDDPYGMTNPPRHRDDGRED